MDPCIWLLDSVAWDICSTHHTILQKTPGQLEFGIDMLLNPKVIADCEAIRLRKQKDVDKNNMKENSLRIHHNYQVGDKVLITNNDIHRKLDHPTKFPYPIVQVYSNGTACVQNDAMTKASILDDVSLAQTSTSLGGERFGSSSDTTANKLNT